MALTVTTHDSKAADSSPDLVAKAGRIAPHISEVALEAEKNRRVPDSVVAMIEEAGLYQTLVPKMFGGHEMSIPEFVEVILALSPLDASTGWVSSFHIGHNWMWCLLPEKAQREIFADRPFSRGPIMVAPTVKAVAVEGGYRINGRAKWGTGSAHAQWCMVTGFVQSDAGGPPEARMFAMPWSEAKVEDTWHTSGMATTASHDVIFDDIFIPDYRSMNVAEAKSGNAPGTTLHANPLYKTPFTPFLCLIAVAPLVATARGVAKQAVERAQNFVSSYSGKTSIDNPALQIRLAKADLMSRAAETLVRDLASRLHASTQGEPPSIDDRVLMRAQASHIAQICRDTVTMLAQGSGASGHMLDSPVQRAMRDLNMASCHVVFDEDPTMELHGKMLVGLPPDFILA